MSQVSTLLSTPPGRPEVAPRRSCDDSPDPASSDPTPARATFSRTPDTVEFSSAARAASLEKEPPIRTELVQKIRAQIASGQYDETAKLDIAADRLLKELGL